MGARGGRSAAGGAHRPVFVDPAQTRAQAEARSCAEDARTETGPDVWTPRKDAMVVSVRSWVANEGGKHLVLVGGKSCVIDFEAVQLRPGRGLLIDEFV